MSTSTYSNQQDLIARVSPLLDDYTKFTWCGIDMWEKFHAFIISEKKGSLQFYNGPSFSNSYTKPQFESASTHLTGVTFNTQQISFTIAVYAVTIQEYRQLIYTLHPYEINDLTFSFNKEYRYTVKLSKIGDSPRYIIGKNSNKEDLYYTELKLTFDIQGDAVAQSIEEMGYTSTQTSSSSGFPIICNFYTIKSDKVVISKSDLDTPFLFTFKYTPSNISTDMIKLSLRYDGNIIKTPFILNLKNLNGGDYYFEYNSQTGDLMLLNGNKRQVLSLLYISNEGKRIIQNLNTTKVLLPGTFNGGDWSKISLELLCQNGTVSIADGCGINCFQRTNII